MRKLIEKLLSKQFLKYLVVGFTGTAIDFGIMYMLVEYTHLYYLPSAVISVAIVLWYSFTLNKFWTFHNHEKKYFSQFIKYALSHAIALGVNLLILTLLVEWLHLWYIFAKVFATAGAAITNFLLVKTYIFERPVKQTLALEK